MLSKLNTATVVGIDALPVDVEVDVTGGFPGFFLVGLPTGAMREGGVRIRAALCNSGFGWGSPRVTVNLAPADLRKDGASFDLPIAVGILASRGEVDLVHKDLLLAGELSLDGRLKPIRGALSLASAARAAGLPGIALPEANAPEAAQVSGVEVFGLRTLRQAVGFLAGRREVAPVGRAALEPPRPASVDYADVHGQQEARRAAEVAAAGGHNLILLGSPGSGKTMIARRLGTIMPALSRREAIETTKVHSVAGLLGHSHLLRARPFRAPHHTCSSVGLVGGGTRPRPGEVSLAHNGVLFLDELPEFQRGSLEALRQPVEDGRVTIVRSQQVVTYPARFMMVAAMNPCPCGYRGSNARVCTCGEREARRYMSRISGPLLDRFDLFVQVAPVQTRELVEAAGAESSAAMAHRVTEARAIQQHRFRRCRVFCNAQMSNRQLKRYASLDAPTKLLLQAYAEAHDLSGRAIHRGCKVARTLADLDGQPQITEEHMALALTMQQARWA